LDLIIQTAPAGYSPQHNNAGNSVPGMVDVAIPKTIALALDDKKMEVRESALGMLIALSSRESNNKLRTCRELTGLL
jgi:hypothetical protein